MRAPTVVATTFEMVVTTASLKRAEETAAKKAASEKSGETYRASIIAGLKESFASSFTSECFELLNPRLHFDLHKWPSSLPDKDDNELIGAKFTFNWEDDAMEYLIGQNNGRDWILSWIDKASLNHDEVFAHSDLVSGRKWTKQERTENLYKALEDTKKQRDLLAKQAADELEKALVRERLTKSGRWRVELCPAEKLQDVLNRFQTKGLEVKYLFPPTPHQEETQEFVVVAWSREAPPSST